MYIELDFGVVKLLAIVMIFAIYARAMIKILGKEK